MGCGIALWNHTRGGKIRRCRLCADSRLCEADLMWGPTATASHAYKKRKRRKKTRCWFDPQHHKYLQGYLRCVRASRLRSIYEVFPLLIIRALPGLLSRSLLDAFCKLSSTLRTCPSLRSSPEFVQIYLILARSLFQNPEP
jgi:hypothetical protein